MKPLKKIAITCGDPAGVGPEIVENWLKSKKEWCEKICPIGPAGWISSLGIKGIPIGDPDFRAIPGQPTDEGARVAWRAMEMAASGCHEGLFRAVVTGPISKHSMKKVGFPFPGQTEFFADRWKGSATMGFCGERLRVVLATWHIPLTEVAPVLTKDPTVLAMAIERADLLARLEGVDFPRIAVCGLNPHAGEHGDLGREELDLIDPQLRELQKRFPGLSLTLPADTVFHRALAGDFDIVVALYHDQGLIPLKTMEFHSGVNISLGLPHIRTSPDHGTGFDIAGQGFARWLSFERAVLLADRYSVHS